MVSTFPYSISARLVEVCVFRYKWTPMLSKQVTETAMDSVSSTYPLVTRDDVSHIYTVFEEAAISFVVLYLVRFSWTIMKY